MAKMIRKRLVSLVIILFGLSVLTFGLTYLLPSDPVEELITSMGGSHDPETIAKLEEKIASLDRQIAANATNSVKLRELMEEQEKVREQLEEKEERWMYLNELAEEFGL